jgi:3-hydroxymyristoyl/3-hydroxydecanoyl-(acyl carrier protein) dehydratase
MRLANFRFIHACARALNSRTEGWRLIRNADVGLAVARLKGFSSRVLVSDIAGDEHSATGVLRVRKAQFKELRGHFPGHSVLPAVLMLESMFQTAAARLAGDATVVDICRVHEAHFRRPILDGEDVLVRIDRIGTDQSKDGDLHRFQGQAHLLGSDRTTSGTQVADAVFDCKLTNP